MKREKNEIPDYVWETAEGRKMWVSAMNTKHIINTLKMLQGKGKQEAPDFWNGRTKQEWIMIFNDELDYRRTEHLFKKNNPGTGETEQQ